MVWLAKLVVAQLEVAKWTNKCSKCWLFWECPLMHFKSCLKWVQFPGMGDSGVNTTQRSPKSGFSSLCKKEKNGRRCVNTCISCCYFQPAPRGRMFFFFFGSITVWPILTEPFLVQLDFFFFFFLNRTKLNPCDPTLRYADFIKNGQLVQLVSLSVFGDFYFFISKNKLWRAESN